MIPYNFQQRDRVGQLVSVVVFVIKTSSSRGCCCLQGAVHLGGAGVCKSKGFGLRARCYRREKIWTVLAYVAVLGFGDGL